jgi:hypothetical protein
MVRWCAAGQLSECGVERRQRGISDHECDLGYRGVARSEFLDRGQDPHSAQGRPPGHAGLVLEAPCQRPRREADLVCHVLEADLAAEPLLGQFEGPAQFR